MNVFHWIDWGSFKQPQKSEAYNNIGLTRESNRWIVVRGCFRNKSPSLVFKAPYALSPLSLRSVSAIFRLRDGVTRNPKYLYYLTISMLLFPNRKYRLISLSILLKIIHLVLSNHVGFSILF